MITRIHVNQHIIKSNKKNNQDEPPLTIIQKGKSIRAKRIEIEGPSTVVYSPDKPLSCGARVWIETTSKVRFSHET